jgi:hypothetical protein
MKIKSNRFLNLNEPKGSANTDPQLRFEPHKFVVINKKPNFLNIVQKQKKFDKTNLTELSSDQKLNKTINFYQDLFN